MIDVPFSWDLSLGRSPPWKCPVCGTGRLAVPAQQWHEHEIIRPEHFVAYAFDPSRRRKPFVAFGRCRDISCKSPFSIAGAVLFEQRQGKGDIFGNATTVLHEVAHPSHVDPAPALVKRAKPLPAAVEAELRRAEELFWPSPAACGNAIRCVVEALLDDQSVPKAAPRGGRLSAHQRINAFARSCAIPGVCEQLEAIKWLGNFASHYGEQALTRAEVVDALNHLERALDDLYGLQLHSQALRINAAKGPASRRNR